MACNFSTTNKFYEVVSTAVIMNSFKHYFRYTRVMTFCGINNVYFDGNREDWVKIKSKLLNLKQYSVTDSLTVYIEAVSTIIDEFIDTFDGQPDVNWWNRIIGTEEMWGGSGVRGGTYVQGWILSFFGKSCNKKIHIDDIPSYGISVPIKLVNKLTCVEKQLELTADWVSVSKVN